MLLAEAAVSQGLHNVHKGILHHAVLQLVIVGQSGAVGDAAESDFALVHRSHELETADKHRLAWRVFIRQAREQNPGHLSRILSEEGVPVHSIVKDHYVMLNGTIDIIFVQE